MAHPRVQARRIARKAMAEKYGVLTRNVKVIEQDGDNHSFTLAIEDRPETTTTLKYRDYRDLVTFK